MTIANQTPFAADLIAPCGINCRLCSAFLRERKPCAGCLRDDTHKPNHCMTCRIKYCAEKPGGETAYCFTCAKFPCIRVRNLDKRYRTKYGTNVIANLENIRRAGVEAFLVQERERWKCAKCGGVICMHRAECISCGAPRSMDC